MSTIKFFSFPLFLSLLVISFVIPMTNEYKSSSSVIGQDLITTKSYDTSKINVFYNLSYTNDYGDLEENVLEINYWILTQDLINYDLISPEQIQSDKENNATDELNQNLSMTWEAIYSYEDSRDTWYTTEEYDVSLAYYDSAIDNGHYDFNFNDNYNIVYGNAIFDNSKKDNPDDLNNPWSQEEWEDNGIEVVISTTIYDSPDQPNQILESDINPIRVTPIGDNPHNVLLNNNSLNEIEAVGIINGIEDQRTVNLEFSGDGTSNQLVIDLVDTLFDFGLSNTPISNDNIDLTITITYGDGNQQTGTIQFTQSYDEDIYYDWINTITLIDSYVINDITDIETNFVFEDTQSIVVAINNTPVNTITFNSIVPESTSEIEYWILYDDIEGIISDANDTDSLSNGAIIGIIVSATVVFLTTFFVSNYRYEKNKKIKEANKTINKLEQTQLARLAILKEEEEIKKAKEQEIKKTNKAKTVKANKITKDSKNKKKK